MFDPTDVNGNAADPLIEQRSDHGRELFEKITAVASGFSYDDVLNAATNLLINAIRQQEPTAREAESAFDQIVARTKGILLELHYDAATGKRKSVFAHHQVIRMPFFENRNKVRGQ
jgi:hypothetical protein